MMSTDLDERVHRGGHSLMTVFGLPSALIGLVVWALIELTNPGEELVRYFAGLLTAIVFGGGTYLLVVLKGQVLRTAIVAAGVGALLGALAVVGFEGEGFQMSSGSLVSLAVLGMTIVLLPFIRASAKGNSFFDYRPLYADAWNLPVIVGISQLFVGGAVLLAFLIAQLFSFIGLGFLKDLLENTWFMMPFVGLLEGVAIGVTRQREKAVLAARGIKMALLRVTAPVFAAAITIFVGAVMIRGFEGLLTDLSPVGTLTASGLVAIIMINAIVADEGRPENALFGGTARLLGVVLLFLMMLAVYGLYLRIGAEGWTPSRIFATLVVGVTTLYAPTYAAAALAERWVILRQGNIAISGILLLLGAFVLTPLFKPLTWSAQSQVAMLEAEAGEATAADLVYLRDRLGEPGRAAFDSLREGTGALAAKAQDVGEKSAFEVTTDQRTLDDATIVPDGAAIPEAAVPLIESDLDRRAKETIVVVTDDGIWLFEETYRVTIQFFAEGEDGWSSAQDFSGYFDGEDRVRFFEAVRSGDVGFEERTYRVPLVGGEMLPNTFQRWENFEVVPDAPPSAEPDEEPLGLEEETPN